MADNEASSKASNEIKNDNNIELTGRVAKFPKGTKAVRALQFLEQVKVNPQKLWYIVIEDQGSDLKTVKYNRSKGVNLLEYTTQLKAHYLVKHRGDSAVAEALDRMTVEGEEDFSVIKNIPQVTLESGQTLISKIASDLIKLLSVAD